MKYSEYFEIDKNYYPEINPDSVKDPGNKWQYTYPHETFVDLLSSVELMLNRENKELRKGIWVEGSYGTGKSRVIWALKNLLECSEESFCNYFDAYDEFKKTPDLKDKLLSQRKEKLATVVLRVYPLSFDNCSVSDQFFTDAKYSDAAKKGIAIAKCVDFMKPGIFQEKYVRAMIGDVLGVEDYAIIKPNLSISKLKITTCNSPKLTEKITIKFLCYLLLIEKFDSISTGQEKWIA